MSTVQSISREENLAILKNEYNWYRTHQEELVKRYNGRYLVIAGHKIIGDFSSPGIAYREAIKTLKPGTFMLRHCIPKEEEPIHHFWNDRQITTIE